MTPSAKEVIAAALFEWGGSGQGVDDILAEIATAQAVAILAALDAAGLVVVPREPTEAMRPEELREFADVIDALVRAGKALANCAYNMAQDGLTSEYDAAVLRESLWAWDDAEAGAYLLAVLAMARRK